jgi:ERCC4-type nuclease
VDTREQAPLTPHFPPHVGKDKRPVKAVVHHQPTGDYCTPPLFNRACIERKSPSDFMGTLYSDNRERWTKELDRFATFELVSICVEGERSDCAEAAPGVNWRAVEGDIADLRIKHGIDVAFKEGRAQAAWFVARWLWAAEGALLPRKTSAERLRDAAEGLGLRDCHVSRGLVAFVEREHKQELLEERIRIARGRA